MRRILFLACVSLCAAGGTAGQGRTAAVAWDTTYQVIDGFGAAIIGADGGDELATYADTLFSTTTGAGFSIARASMTDGGEYGPGDCSTVSASCAGSGVGLSRLQLIAGYAVRITATPWSPPAPMKSNGSWICDTGNGNSWLLSGSYGSYATWISNYVQSLANYGVHLYALSLQNEPDFCPTYYGGAVWTAAQLDTFMKSNLGPALSSAGFGNVKIILPESMQCAGSLSALSDTIFNDPGATIYPLIAACHDYGLNAGPYAPAQSKGFPYWQTEVAYLGTSFDPSMSNALVWANQIHNFLTVANGNAWLYWQFVLDASDDEALITSGTVAKRLWAIGNWSRYVRPGWLRIDATSSPTGGVSDSAFRAPSGGQFAIVAINNNASAQQVTFSLSGFTNVSSVAPMVTSATQSLAAQTNVNVSDQSFSYSLPAQSVTTFILASSGCPPNLLVDTPANRRRLYMGVDKNWPTARGGISFSLETALR